MQRKRKSPLIQIIHNQLNAIKNRYFDTQNITMTLSSGYDSNLLLHLLHQQSVSIDAHTVGGRKISEIPASTTIANLYHEVTHHCVTVPQNRFDDIADMLWRMDGYLFQDGIFLQYELAKNMATHHTKRVLLGEMADQILNYLFYSNTIRRFENSTLGSYVKLFYLFRITKKRSRKETWQVFKTWRLLNKKSHLGRSTDIMFDYIIKKNGLMMRSFNLAPYYPFVSPALKKYIRSKGLLNIQKNYYKKEVKKILHPGISAILGKNGGTTDIAFIFKPHQHSMFHFVKSSSVIMQLFSPEELEATAHGDNGWHFLSQLCYLALFEELYLSGKYQHLFLNNTLNIPTLSIMQRIGPIQHRATAQQAQG